MIYPWQFYIFLGYGIPLFLLYIFVLIQLIFNKEFKAPFFKIATILGFVDLISYLSIWIQMKLPLCILTGAWYAGELSNVTKIFLIFNYFISYYFPRIRELLVLASSFNRFTALAFPHKQKEFWSKWLLIIITFACLFPLLYTFQLLTGKLQIIDFYMTNETINSYVVEVSVKWYPYNIIKNAMITPISTFTTSIISLILNMSTLINLYNRNRFRKRQTTGMTVTVSNKTEINLFFISLWDFAIDLIYTIHQLIMLSFVIPGDIFNPNFDQIFLLIPWIFDIIFLSRPFLLIIMCKQMQMAFIIAFKKGKLITSSNGGSTITITSSYAR